MIVVFHYPGCSTCRRAIKWLDEQGVDYRARHIVDEPPTKAELKRIRKLADLPLRKLFNTSGQSYKNGGFKDRLASMSDEEAYAALTADGMLIKRPLLLAEDGALVGFHAETWAAHFGG
ncbi:MAG: arsenate reductase family protein [Polyangiaceae bacterium]